MTCSFLLRRPAPAAADPSELPAVQERPGDAGALRRFVAWLRGDDTGAQLARFALVGGFCSVVYTMLFWPLEEFGSQRANVVAFALSSVLANDLHRRVTFGAGERIGWLVAQLQAGTVSLLTLAATTLALGWLEATSADASVFVQLALVGTVFATIGCLRFAALRWLFAARARSL